MRVLSGADFLYLWEHGFGLHPLDRALLALSAALPETPPESLADWPLGRRNSALAELRCTCFGPNLWGQISCPRCAEDLEFQMDGQALVRKEPESAPIVVSRCSFRLPTSRDLARAARETDLRLAVVQLVESCCMEGGGAADWPDEDLETIGEKMALVDPMAEVGLTFNCAKCGHQWDEHLDIASFFWMEIETRAKRLLVEVHSLATAYGWTEKEILSLSEPRRQLYLDMARA